MPRKPPKHKYNRIIRGGAVLTAALVGVLIAVLAGFLLNGHSPSKDHAACVRPMTSAKA
jgi:hypothetical protein